MGVDTKLFFQFGLVEDKEVFDNFASPFLLHDCLLFSCWDGCLVSKNAGVTSRVNCLEGAFDLESMSLKFSINANFVTGEVVVFTNDRLFLAHQYYDFSARSYRFFFSCFFPPNDLKRHSPKRAKENS